MALVKGRGCEVLEYKEWIMMLYREAMVHHAHNLAIHYSLQLKKK